MGKRIAFPGFGWEFNIKNSFTLPFIDFKVHWYGVIIALGMCLAFLTFFRLADKKEKLKADDVYNITLFALPIGVIGARVAYVINQWEHYSGTGFMNIINLRKGGLAIYGGIIFGLITVLIYCKIKKINALSVLDALAPAVMLGQAIGRWGNFVNGEAYGWSENIDNLPWRMELDHVVVDGVHLGKGCVHPTFIYESLWNLLGLALIIFVLYRAKKFHGEIFFAYLGWYGLGRSYIETLRADSLYIPGTAIKFSVFVGIACVLAAVIGLLICAKHKKESDMDEAEYTPTFAHIIEKNAIEKNALTDEVFDILSEVNGSEDADGTDETDGSDGTDEAQSPENTEEITENEEE